MVRAIAYSYMFSGRCLAHSLQLDIHDDVLSTASVKNLVEKCRSLISFANKSIKFYNELKRQQEIQMGVTEGEHFTLWNSDTEFRWNSTYYMLQRNLKRLSAIICTLNSEVGVPSGIELSPRDFVVMTKIVDVSRPFELAT